MDNGYNNDIDNGERAVIRGREKETIALPLVLAIKIKP